MPEEHSISVVTRLQDNGDGGYTMYVYNDENELLEDHWKMDDLDPEEDADAYKEMAEYILEGHDEYEYGYIGSDTIKVRVNDDGTVELAETLSFHGGQ